MEDLDLALTIAREKLPFSQEWAEETYTVSLKVEEFYHDPLHLAGIGFSGLKNKVNFKFEKMYINELLVGWEFIELSRQ